MKIEILTTDEFDREYKRLKKKYTSFNSDIEKFEKKILKTPEIGDNLGSNIRKVRIAIKSKNKGKRGGARIITYNIILYTSSRNVVLVTVYDKGEKEDISNDEIKRIIRLNGF